MVYAGNRRLKLNFNGGVANGVVGCGFVFRNLSSLVLCADYAVVNSKNVLDAQIQGL